MKIEKVSIETLKPYENNAKIHTAEQIEQIKASIQEFGNNDPIAVDENNVVIEGHGRLQALRQLGYEKVEVIRLTHMTPEQKRAYILVHNKLTMNTGFDLDLLEEELGSITGIDMGAFDFGMDVAIDTDMTFEDDPGEDAAAGGEKVIDFFGGSGSTLMACEESGRTAYVMELDPGYADVILERWEEATGGEAVLLHGIE